MRDWIAGLVLILTSPVWAAECIVIDGDTLTLRGTKFRLDGIDAPEFNQICLDEKGQEWNCGVAARDALAKLIENCAVKCEDKGPDKVHRDRRITAACLTMQLGCHPLTAKPITELIGVCRIGETVPHVELPVVISVLGHDGFECRARSGTPT